MAITRAATSQMLEEIKDKLLDDDVFTHFNVYTAADFEEEKYPEMPFIGLKSKERVPEDLFTRSIRGMEVEVVIVVHAKSDHHPQDASLSGWDYAVWLGETMVNFLNTIDFGDDVFVIERDCMTDVDDTEVNNDLAYVVMATLDMMFETIAL